MIIIETNELHQERTELFRKLDKPYENKVDKENDELRLGEVELEIRKIIRAKINNLKVDSPRIFTQEIKIETVKDARKLRKQKRDTYKDLAKETYNLYLELVEKKKLGAELEEKLQSKNVAKYDLKKLISEVRRY